MEKPQNFKKPTRIKESSLSTAQARKPDQVLSVIFEIGATFYTTHPS